MKRRNFFKFAGVLGAVEIVGGFLHPALAATWRKVGRSTGAAGTWQKVDKVQTIGVASVATGATCTIALRSDGNVFAVGSNIYGQLGDNTIVDKSTYVQAIGV